jgi:hypothetical protein
VKQVKIRLLKSVIELKATGRDLWEGFEHGGWSNENRPHRQM